MEELNNFILTIMDTLLGWSLSLPRFLTLLIVGGMTASLLTFVRLWTTNQDLLRRCSQDRKVLKQLTRQAKASGDKAAATRYSSVVAIVASKMFAAEGKPFLASLLPIILVCTWCYGRLAYVPPVAGEPITVKAYMSASSLGKVAYIVPQDGLEPIGGWVQRVSGANGHTEDVVGGESSPSPTDVFAKWQLQANSNPQPYQLTIRCDDATCVKALLVDGRHYATQTEDFSGCAIERVELIMTPYRLAGFVPALSTPWNWLLVYLLITLPVTLLLKKVCRIE